MIGGIVALGLVFLVFVASQYWGQWRGGADSKPSSREDEPLVLLAWTFPFLSVLFAFVYAEWWLIFVCFLAFMAVVVWSWIHDAISGADAGVARTRAILAHKLVLVNGVLGLLLCIPIVVAMRAGVIGGDSLSTLYGSIVWVALSTVCVLISLYTRRTRVLA